MGPGAQLVLMAPCNTWQAHFEGLEALKNYFPALRACRRAPHSGLAVATKGKIWVSRPPNSHGPHHISKASLSGWQSSRFDKKNF